jgi:hypothetical protein
MSTWSWCPTDISDCLTRLIAREDFIVYCHCESVKSYKDILLSFHIQAQSITITSWSIGGGFTQLHKPIFCYWKVPGLGKKINAGLTYSILAAVSFKIVSSWMYTAIPSFFPHFKSNVQVIFLNFVEYCLRFLWMSDTVSKRCPSSFIFNFRNKVKSQGGLSPASREEGER